MPKIIELYAFVVADKDENDEGIMAFKNPEGNWMPMVGADLGGIELLKPMADLISAELGKPYRILRFKLDGEI